MNKQLLQRSRTQALQFLWQGWKLLLCLLVLTSLNALAQSNEHEYSVLTFDSPIDSEVAIRLGTGPGLPKPIFEGADLIRQEEGPIGTNPWFYLRLKDRKVRIYRTYSLGIEHVESLVGLDVSNSPNMVSLTITDAPRLNQVLDLSSNNKLSVISLSQVGITGLNLSPNSPLISLNLQNISLPSLDVASQNELFIIDLKGVKLPRLEVADLAKLSVIKCSQSEIGSLSLRRCPKLREVEVPNIGLTQFEVEETPELWRLELNNNKLSSLDMSQVNNTGDYGIRLNASHNQLTRFTAGSIRYKTLEITNNQLATLDLSTTSAAKFIAAHINKLNEVKLNPNSSIYSASFIFNSLSLDAMTRFIGSLPRYTPGSDIDDFDHETNGRIYIRATIEPIPEGNRISKSLVKQAKDKGWIIGFYGENGFQDNYEGDPEEVVFYTITTEFDRSEGQISLSVADPTHVRANTEVSVAVEPNTGYELATLTANGKDITESKRFRVETHTTVRAIFRKKPVEIKRYPVTLEQGEGGRIRIKGMSPEDLKAVEEGTELTVSIARQEGYDLATLTANGVDIMAKRKFVVREATVVKATFSKRTYKITLEQREGGTISIQGKSAEDLNAVEDGTELTVLVAPKEGYELESLMANGKDITESKRFRAETHTTVRATFRKKPVEIKRYPVTLEQGEGGRIRIKGMSPEDLKAVEEGTELTVSIVRQEGYDLATLTANGVDIMAKRKFVVREATVVKATFSKRTYKITLEQREGGTISIQGKSAEDLNAVEDGSELTVLVAPKEGYELERLMANGKDITESKRFRAETHTTVRATFRKKPVEIKRYPVTLEQGEGGRIRIKGMSPEDLKAVEEGTELTVSIARQEGYDLATLTANGVDIMAKRKFVVREATVVKATFSKRTYKITLEQREGGTISIQGKSAEDLNAVEDGTELTVLVAPKEGYELESLMANGKDITESKRFRAETHTTVRATFRKKAFRVSHRVEGKGSITFTGADNLSAVPYGTELRVVTANGEGHELTSLTAGGEDILQTKRITVKSSIEVVGVFTKKIYVVTLPEVEHATVRIKGNHDLDRVPYETELELEVKPERGYIVEEVKVNGQIIASPYKFVVKGDVKIEVRIKQDTAIGMVSRSSLRIYPNPASTYIIIVDDADTAKQVRLLNLIGRVVLEGRTDANKRIDVSHLERGIYLLLVDGMAHRVVLR